ncbi:MAG TPA: TonB-dependent receptor [Steroidobacteraceae bacterium]|nr:TonB-dependent receptor [Steroidobacteraceae bacterium]
MKKILLASALAAAQIATSLPAMAQTAAAGDANKPDDFAEIVVTAERRRTDLQKTPIAASVLTGEEVANAGVMTVDQLQFISPSATVNNFGQGIDFNIRGIGKAEHNSQTTTGVITYRDGVATFPGYYTAEPYYDLARVEILRGPQGTFVGENATGGAVFVSSQDPVINGGHTGYISAQAGNYSDLAAQGAINLPAGDKFAARVAFNAEKRDSFYDITGPFTGDDGVKTGSVRVGMLYEPTDHLSINFKADYNYLDLSGYPSDPILATNDPFEITGNADYHALDRFGRAVLKLDYEFADGTTLRSVTGYQQGQTEYRTDLDGVNGALPTQRWIFGDKAQEKIWSQELNLISSDANKLKWVLGAYYQHDWSNFPVDGGFYIGVPPPIFYLLSGTNVRETKALFGQLSYAMPAGFELQLGLRYSDHTTTNDIDINQYGTPLTQQQDAKFTNTSGKLTLNYTIDEHQFVYGFVATGFRPGGLNVPVGLGVPAPFDEEKVKNYEIGWKAGWADGRLRTQLDAYYNHYDNFQVTVGYPQFPTFGFELNNPSTTRIYGFEGQLEAIFGAFSVDAGAGWLRSDLGKFFAVDPRIASFGACDPLTGPATASCINLEGNEQTYAPQLTFNVGLQYVFGQGSDDEFTPRFNYGHVSEQWATLFENEALGDRVEARNILNAQFAWRHRTMITTLYGTNLTDQHYVAALNSGLRFAGAPRQYGIRFATSF